MANEIQVSYRTGSTVYSMIRPATSGTMIWNGSTFETYATLNYSTYVINMTEQGSASAYYTVSFPTGITRPGTYNIVAKNRAGGSPAETDVTVAEGSLEWNGTAEIQASDLATSGLVGQSLPIPIYRGQMVRNFVFPLVSSSDHVSALTSGVVSGQISRDGGSFGALQSGAFTEVGQGYYSLQALTSGDLAGQTIGLLFTAVGISGGASDPRRFSMVLQRTSGYY